MRPMITAQPLAAGMPALPQTCASKSGAIRVVCCEPDVIFRERLRTCLDLQHWCTPVGWAHDWRRCRELLDEFLPEILIVRMSAFPHAQLQALCEDTFPAVLAIGAAPRLETQPGPMEIIDSDASFEEITAALQRMWLEVCQRKVKDLQELLHSYLTHTASYTPYIDRVRVGEGEDEIDLSLDEVLLFAADRNYVRIFTAENEFEIRATMDRLANELPPASFLRIHRCYIINLQHVTEVRRDNGGGMTAVLKNGGEYPVGRNFRVRAAERLTGISTIGGN